jgi:hypothetical protein
MRKKIPVGIGLVLVALAVAGPPLFAWGIWLSEPPLRVGMTEGEVGRVLGEYDYSVGYIYIGHGPYPIERYKHYPGTADVFGNRKDVVVYFDDKKRAKAWKVEPLPRTRPPWVDRVLNSIGW